MADVAEVAQAMGQREKVGIGHARAQHEAKTIDGTFSIECGDDESRCGPHSIELKSHAHIFNVNVSGAIDIELRTNKTLLRIK